MSATRMEIADNPPRASRDVCAVLIAYHPGPDVVRNVLEILKQVSCLVVVDNGASDASRSALGGLEGNPAVIRIENAENLGIATAQNQGVAYALGRGFAWVATFDQDSLVPPGYFDELLAGYVRHPQRERIALLVPLFRDANLGFVFSSGCTLKEPLSDDVAVPVAAASGNLVSAAALREVGGFRDDLFIGYVDFEFCLRCRRAGWLVVEVRRVILEHSLGNYELRRWLGGVARINDYNAARRYYNARNQVIVYARYGLFDFKWFARDFYYYSRDFIKLILYSENRGEKLRAVITGYWHALDGRLGPWKPRAR